MTDQSRESFAALLVAQGATRFYMMSMPSKQLADSAFIDRRNENPKDGFQRKLDSKRAQAIADFIDNEAGFIPTAIILSAQPEASFTYNPSSKTASFKITNKSFMILDGQHRVYGFSLAKTDVRVPVIIFAGLSLKQEVSLFIDINTKQKPVPSELLLDIKNLAESEDEIERNLREIFDLFKDRGDNTLSGLMSASERSTSKISRTTFNAGVKKIYRDFDDYSNEDIYNVINSYLESIKITLLERDVDFDAAIVKANIFRAVIESLPDFAQLVAIKFDKKFSTLNFYEFVYPVFQNIPQATFTGKNVTQGDVTKKIAEAAKRNRRL